MDADRAAKVGNSQADLVPADLQKLKSSSKSIEGATEYSTARNSLRIIVLLSFSAIGANDAPRIRPLKIARNYQKIKLFPGSSMVEHSAVNRRVASSNLARGAIFPLWFNRSLKKSVPRTA
jgi:hypothetical protein